MRRSLIWKASPAAHPILGILAPVRQRQTLELVPLSYNLWIDANRDLILVSWQEH